MRSNTRDVILRIGFLHGVSAKGSISAAVRVQDRGLAHWNRADYTNTVGNYAGFYIILVASGCYWGSLSVVFLLDITIRHGRRMSCFGGAPVLNKLEEFRFGAFWSLRYSRKSHKNESLLPATPPKTTATESDHFVSLQPPPL